MADSFQFSSLASAGGPAFYLLGIAFLIVCVIVLERWYYLKLKDVSASELLKGAADSLQRDEISLFKLQLASGKTPAGYVLSECLDSAGEDAAHFSAAYEEIKGRAVAEKLPEMERYVNILATLGTVSPYIGLLGTVFGIIHAFTSLGQGADSMTGLNAGIAEALVATAAGLFVAIPSTMAFNYFRRRIERMVMEIEIAASRMKIMMLQRLHKK